MHITLDFSNWKALQGEGTVFTHICALNGIASYTISHPSPNTANFSHLLAIHEPTHFPMSHHFRTMGKQFIEHKTWPTHPCISMQGYVLFWTLVYAVPNINACIYNTQTLWMDSVYKPHLTLSNNSVCFFNTFSSFTTFLLMTFREGASHCSNSSTG